MLFVHRFHLWGIGFCITLHLLKGKNLILMLGYLLMPLEVEKGISFNK